MPALSPAVSTINTQDVYTFIDDKFWYRLYGDDDEFARFKEWAKLDDNINDNSSTHNMQNNADDYTGYVFKTQCDASQATTDNGSGCCLRSGNDGGWCLISTNGTTPMTYSLTDANFVSLLASS